MATDEDLINQLIQKIGSDYEPVMVPVVEENYSRAGYCFQNVEYKIKLDGGSVLYGWSVLLGKFLIEAERHAVWKSPTNELIDITPSTSRMNTTLFIPDDMVYTGQYFDNVRVNATTNKVVDDWVLIAQLRSKLFNTGTRNGDEIIIPPPLHNLYLTIEKLNNHYYTFLEYGHTKNSICFCGNDKQYKKCHGFSIKGDCKTYSDLIDKFL